MKIKIKYHGDAQKLEKLEKGDFIDLRAAETVEMKAFDFKLISLGISMQLPEGYEAYIVPRSSTYKNFGVIQANHMGVVDNSYSGNDDIWKFPAIALRDTKINKGDRICQFRVHEKMVTPEFIEVEDLGNDCRGGFGSTGTN